MPSAGRPHGSVRHTSTALRIGCGQTIDHRPRQTLSPRNCEVNPSKALRAYRKRQATLAGITVQRRPLRSTAIPGAIAKARVEPRNQQQPAPRSSVAGLDRDQWRVSGFSSRGASGAATRAFIRTEVSSALAHSPALDDAAADICTAARSAMPATRVVGDQHHRHAIAFSSAEAAGICAGWSRRGAVVGSSAIQHPRTGSGRQSAIAIIARLMRTPPGKPRAEDTGRGASSRVGDVTHAVQQRPSTPMQACAGETLRAKRSGDSAICSPEPTYGPASAVSSVTGKIIARREPAPR